MKIYISSLTLLGLMVSLAQGALAQSSSRSIVVFEDQKISQASKVSLVVSGGGDPVLTLTSPGPTLAAQLDSGERNQLAKNPQVRRIDPDIYIQALSHRRQPAAEITPTNLNQIRAPQVWPTTTGQAVKVAVVDSGIDLDHPDLAANIAASANFVDPNRSAEDDNGHGSHIAGTIAALKNGLGVIGVAPDVDLYVAKVLDRRGGGFLSDIIAGIDWAIEQRVDVINLSLGTTLNVPSFAEAIERAREAQIVVVAAAGNDGGSVLFPAAYPNVIAVGAVDEDGQVARFSSRGPELDVVAPGEHILSTYKRGRYRSATGTSMSAAHVSGLAALLLAFPGSCDTSGDGDCSVAEVEKRLETTATDLENAGRDNLSGFGLIDAVRAVGI